MGTSRCRSTTARRGADRADRRRPDLRPANTGSLVGGHAALSAWLARALRRQAQRVLRREPRPHPTEGFCLEPGPISSAHPFYRGLLKLGPEYAGLQYPTPCQLAHDISERDTSRVSSWPCVGNTASSWARTRHGKRKPGLTPSKRVPKPRLKRRRCPPSPPAQPGTSGRTEEDRGPNMLANG